MSKTINWNRKERMSQVIRNDRVSERHQSNNGEWATIIGREENEKGKLLYKVRFDSGFEQVTTYSAIINGKMKDGYSPSLCGVGYLGYGKRKGNEKFYEVWMNMIKRCYDGKSPAYYRYGEVGVTVCDRWKCFEYFLEDIFKVEGHNESQLMNGELHLDKDIKQKDVSKEQVEYSLEKCMFVTRRKNYQNREYKLASEFIAVSPDGIKYEESNLSSFCREHGISQSHASEVLTGKLNHTGRWTFIKKG